MADPISTTTLPLQGIYLRYQLEGAQHSAKSAERAAADPQHDTLRTACQELESIFLSLLLKEMRATINRSGFISGGTAENIFTTMMDAEMTKGLAARGGIGLSELLMEQLGDELDKKDGRNR
ncbi:MAG: rod-binding protein [Desulfobacterales bacterium]|nr:MAG: rod-binding protein [Desulfobacterales bacterium]